MTTLFNKFKVYKNRYGEFEIANENEMVMTDKYTGEKKKCKVDDFCNLIKMIYPDRKDQKKFLQEIFRA